MPKPEQLKRTNEIYEKSEKLPAFFMYSKDVKRKTDKIAFEIKYQIIWNP